MKPRSLTEWRLAIQEVWDAIGDDLLTKFCESMPQRIQKYIDANGATIK
jgi:hypothetical protein